MHATGYVYRGGNKLTDEQKEHLLKDYALLPRDKGNKVKCGYLADFARHWGITTSVLRKLLKAAGVK